MTVQLRTVALLLCALMMFGTTSGLFGADTAAPAAVFSEPETVAGPPYAHVAGAESVNAVVAFGSVNVAR